MEHHEISIALLPHNFCFPFWKDAKESSLFLHGHPGMLMFVGGTLCQVVRSGDSTTGAWGQTWVYFALQASVQKHLRKLTQCPPGADPIEPVSSVRRSAVRGKASFIQLVWWYTFTFTIFRSHTGITNMVWGWNFLRNPLDHPGNCMALGEMRHYR